MQLTKLQDIDYTRFVKYANKYLDTAEFSTKYNQDTNEIDVFIKPTVSNSTIKNLKEYSDTLKLDFNFISESIIVTEKLVGTKLKRINESVDRYGYDDSVNYYRTKTKIGKLPAGYLVTIERRVEPRNSNMISYRLVTVYSKQIENIYLDENASNKFSQMFDPVPDDLIVSGKHLTSALKNNFSRWNNFVDTVSAMQSIMYDTRKLPDWMDVSKYNEILSILDSITDSDAANFIKRNIKYKK